MSLRTTSRPLTAVAVLGALALGLAACAPAAETKPAETAEPTATATAEPAKAPLFDLLPERIQESGEIIAVGDSNPPFRVLGANDEFEGLQADLFAEFSELFGVEFKVEAVNGLAAVKTGMVSGRYDMAMGPLTINADAIVENDFVHWLNIGFGLYYNGAITTINEMVDLCGQSIGFSAGSTAVTVFQGISDKICTGEPIEIVELSDQPATILAVDSERVDFAGMTVAAAAYAASKLEGYDYFVVPAESNPWVKGGMAFKKGDEELIGAVQAALEELRDNGRFDEIMANYGIDMLAADEFALNGGLS